METTAAEHTKPTQNINYVRIVDTGPSLTARKLITPSGLHSDLWVDVQMRENGAYEFLVIRHPGKPTKLLRSIIWCNDADYVWKKAEEIMLAMGLKVAEEETTMPFHTVTYQGTTESPVKHYANGGKSPETT